MNNAFLRTLFSSDFESFITVKVMSIVYVLSMIFLGIGSFLFMVSRFFVGAPLDAILTIPLAFLFLLILRVVSEASIALVKIAENTSRNHESS
jgi:VIT1/CCC1 family predicted Fe2+/Mn2+ transporter